MRCWMRVCSVFLLLMASCAAVADKKERRDPKELGRVVVVPFLDISGERQEDKNEYRETAYGEVIERFQKHEIAFVPQADVEQAMTALKMYPNDEEDRTKARFGELAKHLNARYVITGTIHNSHSGLKRRGAFGDERKAGMAKVQIQVYDADAGRWAEDLEMTATSTARAKPFSSGIFSRSNKLRVKAVRDATKKAMAAFLKPYPKVHDDVSAQD